MLASARPITVLLLSLFGSVTSLSIHTPAPPPPSQVAPPSPSPSPFLLQSPPSSVSAPPSIGSTVGSHCPLTMSPSTVVVRYEDPFTVNCSVTETGFLPLGWEVTLASPGATVDRSLVWSVSSMTKWTMRPACYALTDQGGPCQIYLPLIVYKPPDRVSISVNSSSVFADDGLALRCEVQEVAPAGLVTVTFYRGRTALSRQRSNVEQKTPVTLNFTMETIARQDDHGAQYWCEAKLELGPGGPQPPLVVPSEKRSIAVNFPPHLMCPPKLRVKEGESLACEVRGSPQPLVQWFSDGQPVDWPAPSSRVHAGKYTAWTMGHFGQINFTVEVEVLRSSGTKTTTTTTTSCFLWAIVFIQMTTWL